MATTTAATRTAGIWRLARPWRLRKTGKKSTTTLKRDDLIEVRPGVYRLKPEIGEAMGCALRWSANPRYSLGVLAVTSTVPVGETQSQWFL
jgi:hypothetical protein